MIFKKIGLSLTLQFIIFPTVQGSNCQMLKQAQRVSPVRISERCNRGGEFYSLYVAAYMPVSANSMAVDEISCEIATGWISEKAGAVMLKNYCAFGVSSSMGGGSEGITTLPEPEISFIP